MRVWAVLGAMVALAVGFAAAADPLKPLQPRDLFSLTYAGDPQVRPDGAAVAYVRHTGDIMTDRYRSSIWLVDANSGAQTPLVAVDRANLAPRWSPDGRRLAYHLRRLRRPAAASYVLWLDSGKAAKLATLEQAPSALAWSPDGRQIALTMLVTADPEKLGAPMAKPEGAAWADSQKVIGPVTNRADGEGYLKPGFNQLFVVSADGGAPRQLTSGKFDIGGGLSWAPDGKAIVYDSNHAANWERDPQESEVFEVDVATGTETQLTHRKGPDEGAQVWPDGRLIAYLGDDDHERGYENERLYVMDRDGGGHPRSLTDGLDRSVGSPPLGGRTARRSSSPTATTARCGSPASAWTASSSKWPPASPAAASTGPIPPASIRWPAASSPSPRARRTSRPTSPSSARAPSPA